METKGGHTPEPWTMNAADSDERYTEWKIEPDICSVFYVNETGEANARRIVACVNACVGINTEGLELIVELGGIQQTYDAVKAQRDELAAYAKCEEARSRGEDIAETVLKQHGFDSSKGAAIEFMDKMRRTALAKLPQ